MRVLFHVEAQLEARKITEYYRRRDPALSSRFTTDFRACLAECVAFPEAGREVHSLGVRKRRFTNFPYQLFYLVDPDAIFVVALGHDRQQPFYWMNRITEV